MTTKQRFALDHAWGQLALECDEQGRMVSAGELAKRMGISRNTAQKRLIEMVVEGAILFEQVSRGRVAVARYGVHGFNFFGRG